MSDKDAEDASDMSDDLVERVARAIAQSDEQNGGPPYDMRVREKHAKNWLFDQARACFAEIEVAGYAVVPVVPSNAMLIAGSDGTCTNAGRSEVARSWSAMIQAARKQ